MKLTIQNIDKLKGRLAHHKWEIQDVETKDDEYVIHLVNPGQFKNVVYWFKIDRMIYGDGYRMWTKNSALHDVDVYFQKGEINTIDGFCEISSELINNTNN